MLHNVHARVNFIVSGRCLENQASSCHPLPACEDKRTGQHARPGLSFVVVDRDLRRTGCLGTDRGATQQSHAR